MALEHYNDERITQAIREIAATYGDSVSVADKAKSLLKFGRNTEVGTNTDGYTVMTLAGSERHETYVSTNAIDSISSASTSDTGDVVIEGHTVSGGNFTFSIQTCTLNGRNKVTLDPPIARSTRAYNDGSTDLVGPIYVYQDGTITNGVPDTASEVHLMIPAGKNQSQKSATTISSQDYWIVTSVVAVCLEKSATAFSQVDMQVRLQGKVFRDKLNLSAKGGDTNEVELNPYMIVPKNADVRLIAVGSGASIDTAGSINGYLAKIV